MSGNKGAFTPNAADQKLLDAFSTFLCWRENIDVHKSLFVYEKKEKYIGVELYDLASLERALNCLEAYENPTFECLSDGLKTGQVLQVDRPKFPRILIARDYLAKHCKYFVLWYKRMPAEYLDQILANILGPTSKL